MDLLRILAYNNVGTIKETTISSIFNYLLNPNEDHGLRDEFLVEYLSLVDEGWKKKRKKIKKNIDVRSEDNLGENNRIDSGIYIGPENNVTIIGTEIKISDKSALNDSKKGVSQLKRYYKALSEIPNSHLIYLVPEEGHNWKNEVDEFIPEEKDFDNFHIVLWKREDKSQDKLSGLNERLSKYVVQKTIDDILHEILENYLFGQISPPDPPVIDLLRSFRNAISNDFGFVFSSYHRFVNKDEFEKNLGEEMVVFAAFCAAAGKKAGRGNLSVQSHLTSVGVPRAKRSETTGDNSLCRILTVLDYDDPDTCAKNFILELPKSKYRNKEVLKNKLTELDWKVEGDKVSGDAGTLLIDANLNMIQYHPNGKEDEEVYLLHITKSGSFNEDEAQKQFEKMIVALIEIWNPKA